MAEGIGADKRIGRSFLNAGLGYGGSCFPKDIAAFIAISEQIGEPFHLLREVQRINQRQRERFLKRLRDTLWVLKDKRIAVWGLTFKPHTDDVRSPVAIELVNDLIREGAHVTAYDPKGNQRVQELDLCPGVHLSNSALEAVQNAEALVLATEWPEFSEVDLAEVRHQMHTPIVFDGNRWEGERALVSGIPDNGTRNSVTATGNVRGAVAPMTWRDSGYPDGAPTARLTIWGDVATLAPNPGLVNYEPILSFWSDYAVKRRWFAVPDLTNQITPALDLNWSLPIGMVWVKHFDLELVRGDPATR